MSLDFDKLYKRLSVFDDSYIVASDIWCEGSYAAKEASEHISGLWRLAVDLGERGKVMQRRIEHLEAVISENLEQIAQLKCDEREIDNE